MPLYGQGTLYLSSHLMMGLSGLPGRTCVSLTETEVVVAGDPAASMPVDSLVCFPFLRNQDKMIGECGFGFLPRLLSPLQPHGALPIFTPVVYYCPPHPRQGSHDSHRTDTTKGVLTWGTDEFYWDYLQEWG